MSQAENGASTLIDPASPGKTNRISRRLFAGLLAGVPLLALPLVAAGAEQVSEIERVRENVKHRLAELGPVERYMGDIDAEAGLTARQMSMREAYRHRQVDIVMQELFA